ncbi:MAG: hypothetical protein U9O56_09325 [Campylobacterota bacterium]|nr:hypothetical protein [Campylobacterota bacterium]
MQLYEYIGLIGVGFIIVAFYLNQANKIASNSNIYLMLNLFGAFMILSTVLFDWNLATFTIESFWIAISLFGLYKKNRVHFQK